MITQLFTETHRSAFLFPDERAANTYTTDWLSMKEYHKLTAFILVGDLGSSATVDAKLQQAKDANGGGAKDITGKAITQLTQAGGDSDLAVVIELDATELDAANKYDHVRLSVTVGTAASDVAAHVIRWGASYVPVGTDNLEEVIT